MTDNNAVRVGRAFESLKAYTVDPNSHDEDILDAASDLLVDIRHLLDTLEVPGYPGTGLSTHGQILWRLLVGDCTGYSRVNTHYDAEINEGD